MYDRLNDRPAHADEFDRMDINSLATALVQLKSAQTASSIQYAVAARLLQIDRPQGAAAIKLIQAAGQRTEAAARQVIDSSQLLDVFA